MELEVSPGAADVIRRKGGTVALDFVSGVSWGGSAEVSVDTYLKGKNTANYLRVTHDDVEVLIAPVMARWSERVSVTSRGTLFGRRLEIEVDHEHGPACRHWRTGLATQQRVPHAVTVPTSVATSARRAARRRYARP